MGLNLTRFVDNRILALSLNWLRNMHNFLLSGTNISICIKIYWEAPCAFSAPGIQSME